MKRRLVKLVVFLLLGAIVNVAVAWGCSIWSPLVVSGREWHALAPSGSDASLAVGIHAIDEQVEGRQLYYESLGVHHEALQTQNWRRENGAALYLQQDDWSMEAALAHASSVWLVTAGWPMPSFQGCDIYRLDGSRASEIRGGLWVGSEKQNWMYHIENRDRFLPFGPIWPGFAINTVFYAAILWVVFAAAFALRRRRRIRRGLCPACAYPVGDSPVCTECGTSVKPS